MRARLLCGSGELKGSDFEIGEQATIGRAEGNTIVLGSPSVSSRHARISRDASGRYVIEDLGSRNGTAVDGRTLRGKEVLGRLHVVNFGRSSSDFVFLTLPDAEPRRQERSSTLVDAEPPPLPAALAAEPADAASPTVVDLETPELPPSLRDADAAEASRRGDD